MGKKALFFILLISSLRGYGQISGPATLCAGSQGTYTASDSAIHYTWTLGSPTINQPIALATLNATGIVNATFSCMTRDGANYYGFVTSYFSNNIYLLNFGADPTSVPTVTNLGNFGLNSNITEGIEVVKDPANGQWYGFVVGGSQMLRLDFGNSPANAPTGTMMTFPANLAWPHQIGIKKYGTQWVAFVANRNAGITRFDFGTSLTNTPTATSLPIVGGVQNPCNFVLRQQQGNYYMVCTNLINGTLSRLDFGANIQNNAPTGTNLGNPGNHFTIPRTITIIQNCDSFLCYVVNENGSLIKVEFAQNITNVPTCTAMGNLYNGTINGANSYSYNGNIYWFAASPSANGAVTTQLLSNPAPAFSYYYNNTFTYTFPTAGNYQMLVECDNGNPMGCSAECMNVQVTNGGTGIVKDTAVCQGNNVTLNATTTGGSYNWSTGATTPTIVVSSSGTYWAQVTVGSCSFTDTFHVTVNAGLTVNLGNDVSECAGTVVQLQSTPVYAGATYTWSTGSTNQAITATTSGNYWLQVDLNGCKGADTVNVNFKPAPVVDLGPDIHVCGTDTFKLLPTLTYPGATYHWSTGSTDTSITVWQTGNYWLEVTGQNGCKGYDSVQVTINPLPVVDLGNDTTICDGVDVPLHSVLNYQGAAYLWSTGATTQTITATQTAVYWLTITKNGCSGSDTVNVNTSFTPNAQLGPDTAYCAGTVRILRSPQTQAADYLWSNGSTDTFLTITPPGTYWLTLNSDGCISSDTVTFDAINPPSVILPDDTVLCLGDFLAMNITKGPYDHIIWTGGDTGTHFTINSEGTFYVSVYNLCGIVQDSVHVGIQNCWFWLPDAFTPNGDGKNDVIRVVGITKLITNFEFAIFNRWGQRVFFTNDPRDGWDGVFKGELQDLGTYNYMISYRLRNKNYFDKGTIQLIR